MQFQKLGEERGSKKKKIHIYDRKQKEKIPILKVYPIREKLITISFSNPQFLGNILVYSREIIEICCAYNSALAPSQLAKFLPFIYEFDYNVNKNHN